MSDLKERIKKVDDIQKEVVHVDEWDADIEVRGMSGEERAEYFKASYDDEGKPIYGKASVNVLIETCYDPETSKKLFDAKDASWLSKKSGAALNRLGMAALRLSGVSADEQEKIKNVSGVEEKDASTSP